MFSNTDKCVHGTPMLPAHKIIALICVLKTKLLKM